MLNSTEIVYEVAETTNKAALREAPGTDVTIEAICSITAPVSC